MAFKEHLQYTGQSLVNISYQCLFLSCQNSILANTESSLLASRTTYHISVSVSRLRFCLSVQACPVDLSFCQN
jgi:hypothetical protein